MPSPQVTAGGYVARGKPSPKNDGGSDSVPFRSGKYQEEMNLSLIPKNHLLADEGSYFVSSNPTPGTGLASTAAMTGIPTLGAGADTHPLCVVLNKSQNNGNSSLRVYLDALQILCTAAGSNGAAINFAVQTDIWANRVVNSALVGGTLITPTNPNQDDGTTSQVNVWFGANTILGSTGPGGTARLLPHRQFRPVIPVVGDIYAVTFGGSEQFVGSLAPAGTSIVQQSFNYPPIILGPGQCALIYVWLPSQSAASSYEFDLSHWER